MEENVIFVDLINNKIFEPGAKDRELTEKEKKEYEEKVKRDE